MPTLDAVQPALLRRLEAFRLTVRNIHWSNRLGGRFVIKRRGSSIEFADYMPYTPGDDIRAIDWNLYARLDRLYVRTYHEEVELAVEIIIDATESMRLPSPKKFARACELAACMTHLSLAAGHHARIGWIAPGAMAPSPWLVRRGEFGRVEKMMAAVKAGGSVAFDQWMTRAVATRRMRGGQAIVLSDWMIRPAELFAGLNQLIRRRVEVKVIQIISPEELDPARLVQGGVVVDSETGATHELGYRPEELRDAVREHNESVARFCKRNGMAFVQHRLNEPLDELLFRSLPAHGFIEPLH